MSAYSQTHEEIYRVLSEHKGDLSAREIYDAGAFDRMDLVFAAVHALSQDGGPLKKITPDDGGKLRYMLRDGITRETFRKPAYAHTGKAKREALGVATPAAPIVGIAPAKAITAPAPIRADEMTRKPVETPATARKVSPTDQQPNTSTSAVATEKPEGAKASASREAAANVVTIGTGKNAVTVVSGVYEKVDRRLQALLLELIGVACISPDPQVRGLGVAVREIKLIRDAMKPEAGRDAA